MELDEIVSDVKQYVFDNLKEEYLCQVKDALRDYVDDAISDIISEDTIDNMIDEEIDTKCVYTSDINEIICGNGLKESVEEYATVSFDENHNPKVEFNPEYAAKCILRNSICIDFWDAVEKLRDELCDELGI